MAKAVKIIQPVRAIQEESLAPFIFAKKRVAGYARVSTDQEQQQHSYETQLKYFTNLIKSRPDWEFVKMYSDEGITGTSIKKRKGFQEMISDALSGKIDLILIKSVSRFARNTVDSLQTIRDLTAKHVEVYFEKENIYSSDPKCEFILTIFSSIAQEESRSISENTTWGQRKRMANGIGCVPYSHFLGYDKGPKGEFVINKEEAKIVKRIFKEYLSGTPASRIAKELTEEGIPTPGKTKVWFTSTVLSILHNEKYKGDCLMQKYYTQSFLSKKQIKNQGELQKYYVEDHHKAIVSSETFDAVQLLLEEKQRKKHKSNNRAFSSLVWCGKCGRMYGSKTCHSTVEKYKSITFGCNGKYEGSGCDNTNISENRLWELYEEAFDHVFEDKKELLDDIKTLLKIQEECLVKDNKQIEKLSTKLEKVNVKYNALIEEQANNPEKLDEFQIKIDPVEKQYSSLKKEIAELKTEVGKTQKGIDKLNYILNAFKGNKKNKAFSNDPKLLRLIIDKITINNNKITFNFVGGGVFKDKIA